MKNQIREMLLSDAPAVCRLMQQLAEVGTATTQFTTESIEKIYTRMNTYPDLYFNYVAVVNQEIVGFISGLIYDSFFHIGGTAIINELIVDKEYRGQGIGRSLVNTFKREAEHLGCDEFQVATEKKNQKAQAFYRRLGFNLEHVLLEMELPDESVDRSS